MGQLVEMPVNTGGLTRRDPRRVALFKNGPGKELIGSEVDEAIEWCEIYGANPFVKDIYFFVFDADKPTRRVVPVLSIMMYRKIAARTRDYLPDDEPPKFTYDESLIGSDNPCGIVDCTVRIKVHRHGDWHIVSERLRWDERAPVVETGAGGEEWVDAYEFWPVDHPTKAGKPKRKKVPIGEVTRKLDPKKPNWSTMPETMHAKCVEAAAIRKAFPNETAGSYIHEELDWANTVEGTAEDITNRYEAEQRAKQIGGPSITLDWCDGEPLTLVQVGKVHDRIDEWIGQNESKAKLFRDRNIVGLREYWAHDKAAALAIRKIIDKAIARDASQTEAAE